jgi:hypothetical protein
LTDTSAQYISVRNAILAHKGIIITLALTLIFDLTRNVARGWRVTNLFTEIIIFSSLFSYYFYSAIENPIVFF